MWILLLLLLLLLLVPADHDGPTLTWAVQLMLFVRFVQEIKALVYSNMFCSEIKMLDFLGNFTQIIVENEDIPCVEMSNSGHFLHKLQAPFRYKHWPLQYVLLLDVLLIAVTWYAKRFLMTAPWMFWFHLLPLRVALALRRPIWFNLYQKNIVFWRNKEFNG